jgi:hypothetical protein
LADGETNDGVDNPEYAQFVEFKVQWNAGGVGCDSHHWFGNF